MIDFKKIAEEYYLNFVMKNSPAMLRPRVKIEIISENRIQLRDTYSEFLCDAELDKENNKIKYKFYRGIRYREVRIF